MILINNVVDLIDPSMDGKYRVLCDDGVTLREGDYYVVYGMGINEARFATGYRLNWRDKHKGRTRVIPVIIWKL